MTAKAATAGRDMTGEIAFLTRALKAPTLRDAVPRLAERARAESWSHEEFLAACLQREVSARESHGGEGRIRAARFPARKALEDFDYDYQRSLKREVIAHLGTLDFVGARENVVFLGPPGTGKTMLSIGLGIRACQAGHRVLFATAAEWVARLAERRQGVKIRASLTRVAAPGRHSLAATARGAANAEPCTTTCKPGNRGRLGKGQSSTQVDHGRADRVPRVVAMCRHCGDHVEIAGLLVFVLLWRSAADVRRNCRG